MKTTNYRPMSNDDADRSRESSRRLGQRSGKGTELLSKLLGRK